MAASSAEGDAGAGRFAGSDVDEGQDGARSDQFVAAKRFAEGGQPVEGTEVDIFMERFRRRVDLLADAEQFVRFADPGVDPQTREDRLLGEERSSVGDLSNMVADLRQDDSLIPVPKAVAVGWHIAIEERRSSLRCSDTTSTDKDIASR